MHPPPSDQPDAPTRIRIQYDPGNRAPLLELPFVIGVLADLSGMTEKPLPPLKNRRFVSVELSNLDALVAACSPRLVFQADNKLSADEDAPKLKVELRFRRIEDFNPDNVVHQVKPLHELLELRSKLADLRKSLAGNDRLEELLVEAVSNPPKLEQLRQELRPDPAPPAAEPETLVPPPVRSEPPSPSGTRSTKRVSSPAPDAAIWSSRNTLQGQPSVALDQIVDSQRSIRSEPERARAKNLVSEFVSQVLDGEMTVSRDAEAMINARIAQIDHLISEQLSEVMHNPAFMNLEASWRGLQYLLRTLRKADGVKVKVLNVGKKELLVQFQRAREYHDPQIWRKVFDQAAGTLDAEPFGLLIGDYRIGRGPEDAELMDRMARLGAAAHVPFVARADPGLLRLDSFTELTDTFRLWTISDSTEYAKWNSVRARAESRYIGLVLPHMLLRLPYGRQTVEVESFDFEEARTSHAHFLWGNAVWAFAGKIAWHFARYGWFGGLRNTGDSGEVVDLPVYQFFDDADVSAVGPTEVPISDARYVELRSLGLIPLCADRGSPRGMFFEAWSCHKPRIDPDEDAPTTYESAEIDCVLAVSRIAHYLRCIVRQDRQRFGSVRDCEEYLRKWIAQYVVPEYARDTEYARRFPLLAAEARIKPPANPAVPGKLEVSIIPQRAVGTLTHAVEITIPVPLPFALASSAAESNNGASAGSRALLPAAVLPVASHGPTLAFHNSGGSGRDEFIRRVFLAEACITKGKLDSAALILEALAEQIDRHQLEQWEAPQLVTHVWDLLRRCYQITLPSSLTDERCTALLRRICRVDPTRALE